MLPNVLDLLDISIAVYVDESQLYHDLSQGDFTDSCLQVALKLEKYLHQVLFKPLQEKI